MAHVRLRAPLTELTGGSDHELDGATVLEVLETLERRITRDRRLDARRAAPDPRARQRLRQRATRAGGRTAVGAADRMHVLPSITGGESMTELLVGTKKGLFVLEGDGGGPFEVTARAFAGQSVEYAMRDPRTAATSPR